MTYVTTKICDYCAKEVDDDGLYVPEVSRIGLPHELGEPYARATMLAEPGRRPLGRLHFCDWACFAMWVVRMRDREDT